MKKKKRKEKKPTCFEHRKFLAMLGSGFVSFLKPRTSLKRDNLLQPMQKNRNSLVFYLDFQSSSSLLAFHISPSQKSRWIPFFEYSEWSELHPIQSCDTRSWSVTISIIRLNVFRRKFFLLNVHFFSFFRGFIPFNFLPFQAQSSSSWHRVEILASFCDLSRAKRSLSNRIVSLWILENVIETHQVSAIDVKNWRYSRCSCRKSVETSKFSSVARYEAWKFVEQADPRQALRVFYEVAPDFAATAPYFCRFIPIYRVPSATPFLFSSPFYLSCFISPITPKQNGEKSDYITRIAGSVFGPSTA